MAVRFSLDTSCVLNLLNPDEAPDEDLVKLLRLGMLGEVELFATETLPKEIADAAEGRRGEVAKRARFLPVIDVPLDRASARDALAESLFRSLWPNSDGTTKMADHARRDCAHLASHIVLGSTAFVTRDAKLSTKAANRTPDPTLKVLTPKEAVALAEQLRPKRATFSTQSFAVRRAADTDMPVLRELLEPLRDDYQDFEGWLTKTVKDHSSVVNLGVVDGQRAQGVAIWKPKDARTAKLSTFYLHPNARSLGLGQHMLFHCLRQWIEKKIERAYVTASARHDDIVEFCLRFGFRIEGAAQRRYVGGGTELILTKHLIYDRITDERIGDWVTSLGATIFSITPPSETQSPSNWFIPPRSLQQQLSWDPQEGVASLVSPDARRKISIGELEELFYPARIALRDRAAYVVPIQPQWAERMMEIPRPQEFLFRLADKLMLRIDNAYYCSPVYAEDSVDGAPILFYVSQPDSALTGVARILTRVIARPEDLYLRFGQIGIYALENIRGHVAKRGAHEGSAMAMHFGWWVPFPKAVPLDRARELGLFKGHPQRMLRIRYEAFERAMHEGGLEW